MNRPSENTRRALGKGLHALLPTRPVPEAAGVSERLRDEHAATIPIDLIDPNPVQPRRAFEPAALQELAQSIRQHGIIQPLVVRRHGSRYQLVAGERRWRAARMADLTHVPVVVQEVPDERLLEVTLIENVQREDLNPIELALAFDRMARELRLNQEQIGERTGKDRATIANAIRLLQLPSDLQQLVAERRLSPGHARCLLGLPTEELRREVAERAVAKGWSVRETERITQRMLEPRQPKSVDEAEADPNVKAAIEEMERALGTRVRIVEKANNRGKIEIEYYSTDDLDRIYSAIVHQR